MSDVDYQKAGQVRQLLAERANADAYGNGPRVEEIDRQLADLGHVEDKPARVVQDEPPQGRSGKPLETADEPAKRGPGRPRKSAEAQPEGE